MPNIKTRLEEIAAKIAQEAFFKKDHYGQFSETISKILRQAFLELLEGELNSILPPEKELIIPAKLMDEQDENFKTLGFNACRIELLSRIKARLEH